MLLFYPNFHARSGPDDSRKGKSIRLNCILAYGFLAASTYPRAQGELLKGSPARKTWERVPRLNARFGKAPRAEYDQELVVNFTRLYCNLCLLHVID